MKMEKLLRPQSMRADRLFLHLIGSRLHRSGRYRGPEEVIRDILGSASSYTQIKGIYETYCEEGLRNLSPANYENFHKSGKFERLNKGFEKKGRDAAREFYGVFQDHSRRYNDDTEVFPSHLTSPELREQFERTWCVQFRGEGRQFEKYVRIHHFPGTVLKEADLKLCEVGRNTVMLEMLEKVSYLVD